MLPGSPFADGNVASNSPFIPMPRMRASTAPAQYASVADPRRCVWAAPLLAPAAAGVSSQAGMLRTAGPASSPIHSGQWQLVGQRMASVLQDATPGGSSFAASPSMLSVYQDATSFGSRGFAASPSMLSVHQDATPFGSRSFAASPSMPAAHQAATMQRSPVMQQSPVNADQWQTVGQRLASVFQDTSLCDSQPGTPMSQAVHTPKVYGSMTSFGIPR
eukprot:TRINITY_DN9489_c0_g1_i1.p1 TRINITY_DN9489_c0_g1~~TRINITY_DN9489_c0_g1_i1.p1  ORF type:complete len:228 (+),score=41.51 TRINITY_DN9489_c0_g1_i1:32-685(+)